VINYFPKYLNNPRGEQYIEYCRVKLMLHHPFTDWTDLLYVDSEAYGSYTTAFVACIRSHTHPEDFYTDPEAEDLDSEYKSDEEIKEDNGPLADFEAFARRRYQDNSRHPDPFDSLGVREIDRSYD
jgi:hypothetical protein